MSKELGKGHPYFGQVAVLTTKHDKLPLIAPQFSELIGLQISECKEDTDQLGTFSGEVERNLPPLETAIKKAKLGMDKAGVSLGLASEGSIGPDAEVGFFNSDMEYLVFVDASRDLVISEVFRSFDIRAGSLVTEPELEISNFLEKVDFPNHKLIVTANSSSKISPIKGIGTLDELKSAIELTAKDSKDGKVLIQSDLRAHCSPTRRKNIAHVAQLLATRISRQCTMCMAPGWGRVDYERGLECITCGEHKPLAIKREILGCISCDHREDGELLREFLDPAHCDFCNP
jgi:hypothetical protein